MLCQFSFENYKSYRDETTFEFQSETLPEFSETLLTTPKGSDLLPVGVIYGPNGGGKTNLLQAFACMVSLVVKPIVGLEKNRQQTIIQQHTTRVPFLMDAVSKNEPTVFRVFFRIDHKEYQYYISLKEEIVYEALYWKNIGGKRTGTVFERDGQTIVLGQTINKSNINRDVNPKMPYLSFLAINYNLPVITEVQNWFESCIILNYANSLAEHRIMLSEDGSIEKKIIHALNDMGIDLTGYRFDEEQQKLYTQRTVDGEVYELPFSDESDGTKKLIVALPVLLLALQEGRTIVIDELDAKLHPKLLRYIIMLFKNPSVNKHGAQLLFTSHDMTTMKNTVFRRDEIWFAAEDEKHQSKIYSLSDIRQEDNTRIKNTAAYDKQYLEGRYGADPYLSNMIGGGWT